MIAGGGELIAALYVHILLTYHTLCTVCTCTYYKRTILCVLYVHVVLFLLPSDTGGMENVPQSRMGLYTKITHGQSTSLTCVDPPQDRFSIDWYLNGVRKSSLRNQVSISATDRGVYCCKLTDNDDLAATYCTYVLVRSESWAYTVTSLQHHPW